MPTAKRHKTEIVTVTDIQINKFTFHQLHSPGNLQRKTTQYSPGLHCIYCECATYNSYYECYILFLKQNAIIESASRVEYEIQLLVKNLTVQKTKSWITI